MLATEPVSTTQVPWGNVGWSAGAGGVLAILAVAGALIANMSWLAGAKGPANQGLAAAASWKFSDSWASNLTAVTAAAAAIFTAISDKVTSNGAPNTVVVEKKDNSPIGIRSLSGT